MNYQHFSERASVRLNATETKNSAHKFNQKQTEVIQIWNTSQRENSVPVGNKQILSKVLIGK